MNKYAAIGVVALFGATGAAVAYWGWSDIARAQHEMAACIPTVIDSTAFLFLGGLCLPLFVLLPLVKERFHSLVLALVVSLAVGLPFIGLQLTKQSAEAQSYVFTPSLGLFPMDIRAGAAQPACVPNP